LLLAAIAAVISIGFALLPYLKERLLTSENKSGWTGKWKTSWGDPLDYDIEDNVEIIFAETGSDCTGTYRYRGNDGFEVTGTIKGKIVGGILKGNWSEVGKGYKASGDLNEST
jgi:hypothetical protein